MVRFRPATALLADWRLYDNPNFACTDSIGVLLYNHDAPLLSAQTALGWISERT